MPSRLGAQAASVEPKPGLVITHSVRVRPGAYRLAAPASLDSALLVIRGENLTVDLAGVELIGSDPTADPDRAAGVAIRIEGGRNVRILGGRIRGYRIAILARDTRGLVLAGIDASYNWKPRLYSLVEHESLADWLSYHQNEQREWQRYGAGFYLEGVRGGEIRGSRVTQGMNGLLLTRSDSLSIRDNDFSFNSGLGIGLYRSSDNRIVRNRLDYNVRGYSQGFYHRGQDSAGLLIYEQSSRNVVAWNSATHGGDGLFLWAGQHTMDTGEGGANDNLFYQNDFSFAPANAMEATFSRNSFIGNRAAGSDYGLWGGYSFGSTVAGNCFLGNRIGVAIEHGQDNVIAGNLFAGDTTALFFWADSIQPSDWGYPKRRDTRSRDYQVLNNRFLGNRVALRARNTARLLLRGNRYEAVDSLAVLRDTAGYLRQDSVPRLRPGAVALGDPCRRVPPLSLAHQRLIGPRFGESRSIPATPVARRDRSAIVVDEWGPFDWRAPRLWPLDSVRAVPLRLRTLGPAGSWRIVERRNVAELSRSSGRIGDTLVVRPDSTGNWELVLEYRGGATVTPRGSDVAAGTPVRFGYGRFEPELAWNARFFVWSDSSDVLRDSTAFARVIRQPPLLTRVLSRLDFQWYRPLLVGLSRDRWALDATTAVTLGPGRYRLRTISDDGIRVWVDGTLAIDRWTQHGSEVDEVELAPGRHDLRVAFFQVDGWTELRVEILRAP